MSKISIELGGTYTAEGMFARAQKDMKKFGAETRDMGSAATKVLGSISARLDGEVSTAINGVSGLLQGLATGGLWGMLGDAAKLAIGFVVDKFREAKQAARDFAEAVAGSASTAIDGLAARYGDVKKQIDEAKASAEDAMKVFESGKALELSNKIYKIHMETLQNVTDDMSEKGKAAALALEKLKIAQETQANQLDIQTRRRETLENAVASARDKVAAAENASAEATARATQLHDSLYAVLYNKKTLDDQYNTVVGQLNTGNISQLEAMQMLEKNTKLKAEIDEKYGEQIRSYNEAQAKATALLDELNQANKEHKAALDGQKAAEGKMTIETNKTNAALYELGQAYEKAKQAADMEAIKRKEQIEEEEKNGERRRKWRDRITNEVRASEEEYLELQKAANDAIEEGLSDAKVEKELRAKWLQLMDERNKVEEEERKKKE